MRDKVLSAFSEHGVEVSAQVAAAADSFEAVHVKLALEGLHLPVAVILGEDLNSETMDIENLRRGVSIAKKME